MNRSKLKAWIANLGRGISWDNEARADVRVIDRVNALRILRGLGRFLEIGEGDVKQLQGIEPVEHRLRVGNYRVRFHDFGHSIHIISVRHRRDAYR